MIAARQDYGYGRRRAHQAGEKDRGGALIRGHHRFTDKSHVADVEGNQARLSANADVAVMMEKLFVSRSVTPRRQTASTCFNRRRPSELRRNAAVMSRVAPPGH
jgi:hypothetical protein